MLILVMVSSNLNWGKNWDSILEADAKGYYAYLPAVFIYHDLNFGFFDKIEKEKYYNENRYYDYRSFQNGKFIDKYYAGTALAQLPFFLVAHAICQFSADEPDGYTKAYPILISIATFCYLLLGLIFLNRFLKLYLINEKVRAFSLFATVFGTNLFYYTIGEPGLSHVYSFLFVTAFLFYGKTFFLEKSTRIIPGLAVLLAMIILIRPINGLIVFAIPFLAGNINTLKERLPDLYKNPLHLTISLLLFLIIVSIQPIIYKLSTGSFFIYSYADEGFNFLSPHFFDFLFSYKKGMFLYSPLLMLSLTGGYYMWKKNKQETIALLLFFILLVYVFSSWWNWWYGGSFSTRVFVEFLALFTLLLSITIKEIINKKLKGLFVSLVFFCIVLCQIQTYQYRYYQIHWENMNKDKYWEVFMRIDKLIK